MQTKVTARRTSNADAASRRRRSLERSPRIVARGGAYGNSACRIRRLQGAIAIAAVAAVAGLTLAPAAGAATGDGSVQLYFDAVFNKALQIVDKPPLGESPGDEQIARGALRNASNHKIGSFNTLCVYRKVIDDNAIERCSGSAKTADGTLRFAGPAIQSDADHTWSLTAGSQRYRGITGHIVVHDISDKESLVTGTVTRPITTRLRAGVIARPAANRRFVARADRICARADRALAKLPSFPFSDFDPVRPDAGLLPDVGRFFSGPGDARPALRVRLARLRRLGNPPRQRPTWTNYLSADRDAIRNSDAQIAAALATDPVAFVHTASTASSIYRRQATAATVFGTYQCR